jgi:hypothetical protein
VLAGERDDGVERRCLHGGERTRGRAALVVWRPSADRSASGFLDLPPSSSGANALAAW